MNVKELLKNDSEQMELIALRLKKETTEKVNKIAEVMTKISKKQYSKSKLMRKFIEDGAESTYQQLLLLNMEKEA